MQEYLARAELDFAVLFGSHARGTADESSDVDVALRFLVEMDEHDRFHRRSRIDAELQKYADGFVGVSDIEPLPNHVAYAALQDGILLAGDEQAAEEYKEKVEAESEREESEREQERQKFIDRLARGDVYMVDSDVVGELRHINESTNDLKRMPGMSKENDVDNIPIERAIAVGVI